MNILYVTHNSWLRSTTSSLNAIVRHLADRGLRPVMLFRQQGPWQRELEADGVPCYFDSLAYPEKARPIGSAAHLLRLIQMVKRHGIDLIHCNEHETYPLLRHVARWAGVPIVATLHWNLEPGFGRWAFAPPFLPSALQFLSRAQLEASRKAFPPELGPDRVKLLMSGLAIDDFLGRGGDGHAMRVNWGVDARTIVVGTAAAIKPRKRLEDFILLIGRLGSRGLDVLGVIAGGGPYTDPIYLDRLKDLIHREGLEDHCRLIGNLDPVTPFFRAIDIAINTSEMEILSMSICESMACGKPTLGYDVGGNPEALGDPWSVVPFGDIDAMVDRVVYLIEHEGERQRLGGLAERHVRTYFDAPVLAARQALIYEEILGRPLGSVRSETPALGAKSGGVPAETGG
jgi:glycosyltransferase involved in cell wall biosynthesis